MLGMVSRDGWLPVTPPLSLAPEVQGLVFPRGCSLAGCLSLYPISSNYIQKHFQGGHSVRLITVSSMRQCQSVL